MDDAFTLLRRATGLLPRDARIGIGATVDDVRDFQHRREWGFVLDLLMEFGTIPGPGGLLVAARDRGPPDDAGTSRAVVRLA
ncbi:hypothetical protein SGRIM128S_09057 [Streptomyces griseomycini]